MLHHLMVQICVVSGLYSIKVKRELFLFSWLFFKTIFLQYIDYLNIAVVVWYSINMFS